MTLRRTALALAVLFIASRADAQYKASEPGAGEDYHVEFTLRFWSPNPELTLSTGGLSNLGVGPVDIVNEFGIEKDRFTEYSVTSKAGKHKTHYDSIPISYTKNTVITRTFQFGDLVIPVSVPASTEIDWRLRRYGYEWDFVAAGRGYLGLLADVKDNKVSANVSAVGYGTQEAEARVWIPTVGLGGRIYPHRLFSVTGEFSVEITRFKGFDRLKQGWDGHFADFDFYGTMNMGRNFAVQGGYRSVHVDYTSDTDTANLRLKGLYWGGTARF